VIYSNYFDYGWFFSPAEMQSRLRKKQTIIILSCILLSAF
jgi:hypothetical protein